MNNDNITLSCTFIGFYDNSTTSSFIEYEGNDNTLVFTHELDTNCLVTNNDKYLIIIISNLHVLCSCNDMLLVRYIHNIMDYAIVGGLYESFLLVNLVTRRY